jgi:hypothetical protein
MRFFDEKAADFFQSSLPASPILSLHPFEYIRFNMHRENGMSSAAHRKKHHKHILSSIYVSPWHSVPAPPHTE